MLATPRPPDRPRDSAGLILLRIALVLVGFVLVWLMEDRWTAAREQFAGSFEWPMGTWLTMVGLAVLAGFAFGLAASMPRRFGGYRWGRVLVLGIPGLVLVGLGIAFLGNLEALTDLPDLVRDAAFRLVGFFGPFLQPVAGLVVGIALASGFADPPPRRTGFSPTAVAGPPTGTPPGPSAATPPPQGTPPAPAGSPWGAPPGRP